MIAARAGAWHPDDEATDLFAQAVRQMYSTDQTYHQTKGHRDWIKWMKYQPNADVNDVFNVYGYCVAQTLVKILEQCGDDLTRQNVLHQAAKDVQLLVLLPGLKLSTSATNFFPCTSCN
ncbi:MAG TPA: hypothetical protein VHC94_18055 [Nitrobacter sp.]|jgi:branched-chain amino acid transport system substrate-binding protein|nr:hypothetical protein [Nitrobacter sp.]